MFGIKFKKRDKNSAPCPEEKPSEELAGFQPELYDESAEKDGAVDGYTVSGNLPEVTLSDGRVDP